jgi:hypothetical protein
MTIKITSESKAIAYDRDVYQSVDDIEGGGSFEAVVVGGMASVTFVNSAGGTAVIELPIEHMEQMKALIAAIEAGPTPVGG